MAPNFRSCKATGKNSNPDSAILDGLITGSPQKIKVCMERYDDSVDGNQKSGGFTSWGNGRCIYNYSLPVLCIPGGCLGFLNHQQYGTGILWFLLSTNDIPICMSAPPSRSTLKFQHTVFAPRNSRNGSPGCIQISAWSCSDFWLWDPKPKYLDTWNYRSEVCECPLFGGLQQLSKTRSFPIKTGVI